MMWRDFFQVADEVREEPGGLAVLRGEAQVFIPRGRP
jgi:hypothetical protein